MEQAGGGAEPSAGQREINVAKLTLFQRRAPLHALATAGNSALLCVALWRSAPHPWLLLWAAQQLLGAAFLYQRAQRQRRAPRGSARGIQRAALFCSLAGATLGGVVLLLDGASHAGRTLVLVTLAAMASAASTTLAAIPSAARGYIAGALLLPALYWLTRGELESGVLAALALSLALFLLLNARITHNAFLENLGRARELERLSAQLREERAEWLEWSHATEAFVLLDAEQKVLLWNHRFQQLVRPAALARGADYAQILSSTGMKPGCVEGQPVSAEDWLASRGTLRERALGQLEEYPDGTFYQVYAQALPSGRQVITALDVSALKRTERALREQERALAQTQRQEMVGVIAGGVAHDFNNLLTGILGATELLLADTRDAATRSLLADISASVDRGARLTRQLLAYGRMQSLNPRVLDLNQELRRALPLYRRLLPASVEIEAVLADDLSAIHADPEQLAQVVMNLVLNARDAMPRGGRLRLSTANLGDELVELCVADDGIGMSPATMERMFEPFFSTKDQGRGSGLGLSAVQGIVRQSGGQLAVESRLGEGTRMRVRLPRSQVAAQATPEHESDEAPASAGRARILVVDDEEQVRRLTARLLRRKGYVVLEAELPQLALRVLEQETAPIDLLLTDVVMPEMSGVQLAAAARSKQPSLAVLFMSGYEPGLLTDIDAREVLQKPFTPAQLARAVAAALPSRRDVAPDQTPEPLS
jgi:signal transduction histidine kinase/ActR/RegA family two-component response regulator